MRWTIYSPRITHFYRLPRIFKDFAAFSAVDEGGKKAGRQGKDQSGHITE